MSKFDTVEIKKPKRSTHNLSHSVMDTYNVGDLNLLYVRRCTPTDYVRMKWNTLIKFNPLQAPAFAHMRFKTWAFYVPTSQIDNTFQDMIQDVKKQGVTIKENGKEMRVNSWKVPYIRPVDFSLIMDMPQIPAGDGFLFTQAQQHYVGKLANQMGLPLWLTVPLLTGGEQPVENPSFTALKNKYNLKYLEPQSANNYWNSSVIAECDGQFENVGAPVFDLLHFTNDETHLDLNAWRAYQHVWNEYFRDARLEEKADLYKDLNGCIFGDGGALEEFGVDNIKGYCDFITNVLQMRRVSYAKDYFNTAATDPTLGAQSLALPANITGLRKTNALQKFLEKKALGGNRFADFLLMHFGETPNNYELERPIYLGHSSQPIQISETLQTSESSGNSPQGTRTGNANSYGDSNGFAFRCPDYGYIIVVGALVPEIDYYQGINRKLVVNDWESFPFPEFANIGMQEIKDTELMLLPNTENVSAGAITQWNNGTFGYAPRYIEFKHELNRIQGDFAAPWLNYWHQSPDFVEMAKHWLPHLGRDFTKVGLFANNPNLGYDLNDMYYNRIFAVISDMENHTQCQTYFDMSVNTSLPANEMPKL